MKVIYFIFLLIFLYPINSISEEFKFPNFDFNQPDFLCKEKWTKRGELDDRMYKFCMNQHDEGYTEALVIYNEYKSKEWIDDVAEFSLEKWTKRGNTDYNMFAFQLNKEKEAFLDLQYELKQNSLSQDIANKCKKKWYPQFSMIVYCTKN